MRDAETQTNSFVPFGTRVRMSKAAQSGVYGTTTNMPLPVYSVLSRVLGSTAARSVTGAGIFSTWSPGLWVCHLLRR